MRRDCLTAAVIVLVGLAGVLATPVPVRAQGTPPETIEYYATDALGSVRVVFTPTGQVLGRSDYLPFGETLNQSGTLPHQRFTGQERDGEAGLDYFNARSLQVRTGRFNRPDPLFGGAMGAPQGWNRYAYAANSPLVFVDPTGLSIWSKIWDFLKSGRAGGSGLPGSDIENPDASDGGADDFLDMLGGGRRGPGGGGGGHTTPPPPPPPGPTPTPSPEPGPPGTGDPSPQSGMGIGVENPKDVLEKMLAKKPMFRPMGFFDDIWNSPYTTGFFDGTVSAWDQGYYGCLGGELAGSATAPLATHAGGMAAAKATKGGAAKIAGTYFHLTDGRFTAWGAKSKVLVPQAAGKIALAAEALDAAGWLYFIYEIGNAAGACSKDLRFSR